LCGTELTLSRLPRARRSRTADIGAIYGSIGEGAIEVHHLPPLGDGKGK
jgi:precorrin-6B methylase 2